jgi:hypothetical protein
VGIVAVIIVDTCYDKDKQCIFKKPVIYIKH